MRWSPATATLLLPDQPDNFRITFHPRPDLSDVFTVPNRDLENLHRPAGTGAALGVGRLAVKGSELRRCLTQAIAHLIESTNLSIKDVDIVFTHTSSITDWMAAIARHGLSEKVYQIYPRTGNVVSASIPTALAQARLEGRVKTGDRVMFLMGSAGMSFAACTFLN